MPEMNIIQAVNDCLRVEMRRDSRVVVLGEDVGRFGGVFRATVGLQEEFGPDRCIDTPLAENGIVGCAIGMALYGLRPVAEIQFADYVYPAYDQIVNELAKMRYRSGGEYQAPVVIRMPAGGGIKGGHYHSQSPETIFIHTPGRSPGPTSRTMLDVPSSRSGRGMRRSGRGRAGSCSPTSTATWTRSMPNCARFAAIGAN
jgi:pyruvate dehydrogenase E1 component beta subunit